MKKIIVIQGPTASGKTALAVQVAQRFGTAIVSADSRQCYEGMSVGTAWPSTAELEAVKHYFIGEYPVSQSLTAADYEAIALAHLETIFQEHEAAVICGGTGLYIKALCEGLDVMPQINDAINTGVNQSYRELGIQWLQDAVRNEDPIFYATGEIMNPSRLLRALVFVRSTGQSITRFKTKTKKIRPFSIIKVGLDLPRNLLYERINARVDNMMRNGLLAEVEQFLPYKNLKNLQTVGYTELFDFLEGKYSLAEAVEKIKQHTRNYAKRQITWFKKDTDIHWFSTYDHGIIEQILALLE